MVPKQTLIRGGQMLILGVMIEITTWIIYLLALGSICIKVREATLRFAHLLDIVLVFAVLCLPNLRNFMRLISGEGFQVHRVIFPLRNRILLLQSQGSRF